MLPDDPGPDLFQKGVRAQHPDDRAEGENFNQKFCLVGHVVEKGANPCFCLLLVSGTLFIVGKVQHAPLQGISFAANFQNHRLLAAVDRLKGTEGSSFRDLLVRGVAGQNPAQIQNCIFGKLFSGPFQTAEPELPVSGRILELVGGCLPDRAFAFSVFVGDDQGFPALKGIEDGVEAFLVFCVFVGVFVLISVKEMKIVPGKKRFCTGKPKGGFFVLFLRQKQPDSGVF